MPKPTLNPELLNQHYGVIKEDINRSDRVDVARPQPQSPSRPERSFFRSGITHIAIGAAALGILYGANELAHLRGNQEHAPWDHGKPAQTHIPK